jgi:hypothetical protein
MILATGRFTFFFHLRLSAHLRLNCPATDETDAQKKTGIPLSPDARKIQLD